MQDATNQQDQDFASASTATNGKVKSKKTANKVKVGARASIACVKCRTRKIRCSGDYPSCSFCLKKDLPCDYQGNHPSQVHPGQSLSPFSPLSASSTLPVGGPGDLAFPPTDVLIQAYDAFTLHFEDAGLFTFFHRPTFRFLLSNSTASKELVFPMLCLASRFCPAVVAYRPDAASAYYAAALAHTRETPDSYTLLRMQTLLMLSLYDCMEQSEKRGWALLGQAIRIGQILKLDNNAINGPSEEGNSATLTNRTKLGKQRADDPRLAEERRRTWWCAFLLESLLCDGFRQCAIRYDPFFILLRLPISNDDYYNDRSVSSAPFHQHLPPWAPSPVDPGPEADVFGQTLRIADLYARVIAYVNAGGKNADSRAPWDATSTFYGLDTDLARWRLALPPQLQCSPSTQMAHVLAGEERLFGLMHILYFAAVLYLHRDFCPFLPPANWSPAQGPMDGPVAFHNAPQQPLHYWENSYRVMCDSARSITDLVGQIPALRCNPFIGFALLTAATVHCQLYWFPVQGFELPSALHYCKLEAHHLSEFRPYWPRVAEHFCRSIRRLFETYGLVRDARPPDHERTSKVREGVLSLLQDNDEDDKAATNGQIAHASDYRHDLFALLYADPTIHGVQPATISLSATSFDSLMPTSLFPSDFDLSDINFNNPGVDDMLSGALPSDWSTFSNFAQSLNPFDMHTNGDFWLQ